VTESENREMLLQMATDRIRAWLDGRTPQVAVTLGSGLGGLADRVSDPIRLAYGEVPGFHASTVVGHKGELVAGTIGGVPVVLQSGRFHMYEGHSAFESALPARVFAACGVERLVVTNAAGGIAAGWLPGTLMLITDHLNLTGRNPCEGAALEGEARFHDMSVPYDRALQQVAREVAAQHGIVLEEGVYAGLLGPSYETPAEVRMLRTLGADAVGMSTVVEVIAARARGLRCLGLSLITNPAAGTFDGVLDHDEVMATAAEAGERLGDLVEGVIAAG
jgi:purine-nucleoside phosphorylase